MAFPHLLKIKTAQQVNQPEPIPGVLWAWARRPGYFCVKVLTDLPRN